MDKAFENKLLEEIYKSGFPLELEIVEQLRRANILTYSNISYQDSDRFMHEIDVVALLLNEKNEWKHGLVGIQLLIECKKTEKHTWVFFDEGYNPLHALGSLYMADYCTDLFDKGQLFNPLQGCMNTELAGHHYNGGLPVAKAAFEAFKAGNDSTAIFKAANNIFHGKKYLREWFGNSRGLEKTKGRTLLNQYCIVIDGPLILASKNKTSFDLKQANHILFSTTDTIGDPARKISGNEVFIDIVHKDYFSAYLKMQKRNCDLLNRHLKKLDASGLVSIGLRPGLQ